MRKGSTAVWSRLLLWCLGAMLILLGAPGAKAHSVYTNGLVSAQGVGLLELYADYTGTGFTLYNTTVTLSSYHTATLWAYEGTADASGPCTLSYEDNGQRSAHNRRRHLAA